MMHFTECFELTYQEKVDLLTYLKTFTDYTYLANPDFSDSNK